MDTNSTVTLPLCAHMLESLTNQSQCAWIWVQVVFAFLILFSPQPTNMDILCFFPYPFYGIAFQNNLNFLWGNLFWWNVLSQQKWTIVQFRCFSNQFSGLPFGCHCWGHICWFADLYSSWNYLSCMLLEVSFFFFSLHFPLKGNSSKTTCGSGNFCHTNYKAVLCSEH